MKVLFRSRMHCLTENDPSCFFKCDYTVCVEREGNMTFQEWADQYLETAENIDFLRFRWYTSLQYRSPPQGGR